MLKLNEGVRVFVNQNKEASVRSVAIYSHGYTMTDKDMEIVKSDFYPEDDSGSADKIAKLVADPKWQEVR